MLIAEVDSFAHRALDRTRSDEKPSAHGALGAERPLGTARIRVQCEDISRFAAHKKPSAYHCRLAERHGGVLKSERPFQSQAGNVARIHPCLRSRLEAAV